LELTKTVPIFTPTNRKTLAIMKIPMELLNKWKGLRSKRDNDEIMKLLKEPVPHQSFMSSVARAFKTASCPDHIFDALNKFYSAKESRLLPPMGAPLTTEKPTSHE
jgi:hypothetical protein